MKNDFDEVIDRHNTGSLKYDKYALNRDGPRAVYRPRTLPMWIADMDFRAPPAVLKAIHERTNHGIFGYPAPTWQNKSSIKNYLFSRQGLKVASKSIVLLPGLVVALNLISRLASKRQLSVMTAAPIYPPFLSAPRFADTSAFVSHLRYTEMNNGWSYDFDHMRKLVLNSRETTRPIGWFFLCNPHNPVGKVYSRGELEDLAEFCDRYDLNVCADEVHCDLILDESCEHIPFSSIRDKGVITLHAPSKTYNLAGLTAAFAVITDDKLLHEFKIVKRGICADSNVLGITAMCAAYEEGETWRRELVEYLRGNLKLLEESLKPLGVLEHDHKSTYLAWLNAEKLYSLKQNTKSTAEMKYADRVLMDFDIGLNPGEDFSDRPSDYSKYVRLNFACPRSTLQEAISRMLDH